MIGGIGVDAVSLARTDRLSDAFLRRFYHPDEAAAAKALSGSRRREFLASRFAAKEAFCKALGVGLWTFQLRDVLVFRMDSGKPEIRLFDSARAYFDKAHPEGRIHLSLSHEDPLAVAFVVIEDLS
ncbi:MAG: holo-ACP synthase [Sphaerochaetaceae bacterium]|jgi:holo-[acyl-carrier protein] synthase|nr:holo-ACP synthase [Sphaerochaetaceae bacterium]